MKFKQDQMLNLNGIAAVGVRDNEGAWWLDGGCESAVLGTMMFDEGESLERVERAIAEGKGEGMESGATRKIFGRWTIIANKYGDEIAVVLYPTGSDAAKSVRRAMDRAGKPCVVAASQQAEPVAEGTAP